jgi:hypothetical protein
VLQAPCANAVRALFVFLHLLERHTKRIAYIRLGHAEHEAAHAQTLSNMFVS